MNNIDQSLEKMAVNELIHKPYSLTRDHVAFFRKNRFIKLKNVFDLETLDHFDLTISHKVNELSHEDRPLEKRDTYGKAFIQLFNLWRESDGIRGLVMSKRLAGIAAALMEVDGVRLYHDQALIKEAGGGITPWHADQYYWPVATDKTITAWIPLQATPLEMGPVEFSAGSHVIVEGRNLAISDESEKIINSKLRVTDFEHVVEPFDVGEVSFHSGWIYHRAGANITTQPRKVMTIIYMDQNMTLKAPENEGQENDWKTWCPGVKIGDVIDSPLNPILYP